MPFSGKQIWIWQLEQCLNGNVALIVQLAKAMNCTGLNVKAWDGADYQDFTGQVQQLVAPAHAAGMLVNAWGYSRANNIPGEVEAMVEAVRSGADALIMDAEEPFEGAFGDIFAGNLFTALAKSSIAYAGYAFTSFGLPKYHPTFPWNVFMDNCYAALPQVYFGDFGLAPGDALAQCLAQYAGYGSKPIFPIGQAYDDPTVPYFSTAAGIQAFGAAVKAAGLPGYSFWSLQHMLTQLQAIENL